MRRFRQGMHIVLLFLPINLIAGFLASTLIDVGAGVIVITALSLLILLFSFMVSIDQICPYCDNHQEDFSLSGYFCCMRCEKRFTRRHVKRRHKGCCFFCGYNLKSNYEAGCPECGWHRTTNS